MVATRVLGPLCLLAQGHSALGESAVTWVQISAPLLTSCVTLIKWLNPSVLQFLAYKRGMIMVHIA